MTDPTPEIGSEEWIEKWGFSLDRVRQSRAELASGDWIALEDLR